MLSVLAELLKSNHLKQDFGFCLFFFLFNLAEVICRCRTLHLGGAVFGTGAVKPFRFGMFGFASQPLCKPKNY